MTTQNNRAAADVVYVIDDVNATHQKTDAWVSELRSVELNAISAPWPQGPDSRRVPTRRDIAHFRISIGSGIAPAIVGMGVGGHVAYQLLLEGEASGAVLIGTDLRSRLATTSQRPLMLIDGFETPKLRADQIRATGCCDMQLVNSPRARLTNGECGTELAEYIQGWLAFHQLIEK